MSSDSRDELLCIVFTDVVGWTELGDRIGDDAANALRREHFAIVRAALEAHRGHEIKTVGDSVMATFRSAIDAVRCSVAIQGTTDATSLQVRIGVHAGEPIAEEGDVFGTAVNTAARLCSAAGPGEVLISDLTRSLLGRRGGFDYGDAERLDLKGLHDPVQAFRLRPVGDREDPGAPATEAPSTELSPDAAIAGHEFAGLPTTWTSFVGRTAEIDQLVQAVGTERLVTVFGPGGIGKTRLAMAVAERVAPAFPAGGAFVDLVPADEDSVVRSVAAALDVAERPQTPLDTVVHDRLRDGPTLLVLDNCEHVIGSVVSFVEGVLAVCPEVVILTTTRERIGLPGERVVEIPPLGSDAETLFVDRAGFADAGNDTDPTLVAEVCRRLDGMPLAIELAAARSQSLGVDGLLVGLDDHLRLLSRSSGPGGRHRSLRAVIDWSHDMLDDDERTLFRRLSLFAAGFDMTSAVAVAAEGDSVTASDVIGRLTDKSLLVHVRDATGSRWRMLDTVRSYAREQLEAQHEVEETRSRHLAWACHTADALEAELDDDFDGDGAWTARFDSVADDLRVALAAAPVDSDAESLAFGLALALGHLSYARGFLVEARDNFDIAVSCAPDDDAAVLAEMRVADVAFAEMRGDLAYEHFMRVAATAERAGDARAGTIALADAAIMVGRGPGMFLDPPSAEDIRRLVERARGLAPADDLGVAVHVTLAAAWNGRPRRTEPDPELAAEALEVARRFGDPVLISNALDAVGAVAEYSGHLRESSRCASERLALLDRLPRHDPRVGGEVADIFHMITEAAICAGELPTALAGATRAHGDRINKGLPYLASSRLVIPLALQGSFDDAIMQAAAMRDSWDRAGQPTVGWMAPSVYATALVYGLRGDHVAYDRWWDLARRVNLQTDVSAFGDFVRRRIALHVGGVDLATMAAAEPRDEGPGHYDAYVRGVTAEIAVVVGATDAEQRLADASPLAEENTFVAACLARAAGRLHGDVGSLERSVDTWEQIGARFERACTLVLIPSRREEGERELEALGCPFPATALRATT